MNDPHPDETWQRVWDAILRGEPFDAGDLDPALIETIRQLRARDRVPPPDAARMRHMREELMNAVALTLAPHRVVAHDRRVAVRDATRVLIVGRETLVRRGLAAMLEGEPSAALVGSAATAAEGYRLADELLPDVILVGTTLADAPGLAAASELRRRFPAIATIVDSAGESDDELFEAIRAGAAAYCDHNTAEDRLLTLIRRSATGEYVINEQLLDKPYVAARVLEQFRATSLIGLAATGAFAPLTDRELEILRKVSDGMTNAEIGYALGISSQTVKNHITSILRKLAVNDRTQAVVTALRRGWLTIDDAANPPGRTPR